MAWCLIKQSNIFAFTFSFIFALYCGACISYIFKVSILVKEVLENLKTWKSSQSYLICNETGIFLFGRVMTFQETINITFLNLILCVTSVSGRC
jgi:hypothetical protein